MVPRCIILPMKPAKAMTIRLSAEQADELATVAAIDDRPIAEVIRAAIAQHVESRRRDKSFQDSLRERIERTKRLLG
jgi:predicted transcriptional regulator